METQDSVNARSVKNSQVGDLCAAIITGLGIWWLGYSSTPAFLRSSPFESIELRNLIVKVLPFAFFSLALSLWKNRFRVRWGWIATAVVGLISVSLIDEIIYRVTSTAEEIAFMPAFSPFPLEIVMWLWPALLLMGVGHYLGTTLLARGSRLR